MDKKYLQDQVDAGVSTRQIALNEGVSQTTVRYWMKKYGISVVKFARFVWNEEELRKAADGAASRGEILRTLGLRDSGSSYPILARKAKEWGIALPNEKRPPKTPQRKDGSHYAAMRDIQERQRNLKRTWVCEYLLSNPCVDCGEKDIVVLEFDHTGEVPKSYNVSSLISGGSSLTTLINEVSKCQVRCRNCHMRKTTERSGGNYKTRYLASISALTPTESKQ